jgi:muramoyltetrapeptide carboxypeptidase
MRFAGDDATRIAAIGRAAASKADVAMISRGGYGLTRILAGIPYQAISKSIERGTKWFGLSDFTALQTALLAKLGAGEQSVTWAGPCVCEDFIVKDVEGEPGPLDEITQACFEDVLSDLAEGTGWRLAKRENSPYIVATGTSKKIATDDDKSMGGGGFHIKNATLWGGNLCVLTSLVGTPYFPSVKDQVSGGVLFLEDVGEHPYKIERMLSTLLHAGMLAKQKAIVMGQFSKITPLNNDRGFTLQTVVEWLRTQVKCPVLMGLPMGHVPTKVSLPVGRKVDLVVQGQEALIVWG